MKYYDVLDIFQTVFRELNVQGLAQSIRQKVFDLFDAIFSSKNMTENNSNNKNNNNKINKNSNNNNAAHNIEMFGSQEKCLEILTGVVTSMGGEKDPRCLLVALNMLSKAVQRFSFVSDINGTSSSNNSSYNNSNSDNNNNNESYKVTTSDSSNHKNDKNNLEDETNIAQKIFDSIACYFPITFSPPEDDPFGVTTESLISAIEGVFLSHKVLHPYVLPFLVDHLTDELALGTYFFMCVYVSAWVCVYECVRVCV